MSDPNAPAPQQPEGAEPTAALPEPTIAIPSEDAAPVADASGSGKRRTAIVVLVALVVSAVLGGGAFAVYKVFFDGGPRPAEVLPASTVAVLSLDLDPSAGQKIEGLQTIRKFPQLKEDLGLDPTDDLRKFIVEEGFGCDGLDFDTDVKPWIGKRAAFAAVDLGEDVPVVALALQITDQKKADAGFEDLAECAEMDLGYVVGEDYLIASDNAEHAQAILASGQQHSLADDDQYQKWTDAAGDQGVINFYVGKRASEYLIDGLEDLTSQFGGLGGDDDTGSGFDDSGFSSEEFDFDSESGMAGESAPPAADECETAGEDPFDAITEQLKDFEGLAGTIRFADGGMELSVATSGLDQIASTATVGKQIGSLPADTALAAGFGVPKDYAKDLVEQLSCASGPDGDLVAEAEDESGLDLPDDLTTLLGSALTLSVGGDAPSDLSEVDGLADLPLALAIHGDTAKIEDVIEKVEEHLGKRLEDELDAGITSSDSVLVVSPSDEYADTLLGKGGLESSDDFQDAVPEADKSAAILYLDFDSEWREALLDLARGEGISDSDLELADENTKPLKSLGVSTWVEDGASHILLKLATR